MYVKPFIELELNTYVSLKTSSEVMFLLGVIAFLAEDSCSAKSTPVKGADIEAASNKDICTESFCTLATSTGGASIRDAN